MGERLCPTPFTPTHTLNPLACARAVSVRMQERRDSTVSVGRSTPGLDGEEGSETHALLGTQGPETRLAIPLGAQDLHLP